jgi:hypothetical protein
LRGQKVPVKNSVFTSHVLSNDAMSSLEEIAHAADCTFSKLTTMAGLDPEQDFRFADLSELDFSYSDCAATILLELI